MFTSFTDLNLSLINEPRKFKLFQWRRILFVRCFYSFVSCSFLFLGTSFNHYVLIIDLINVMTDYSLSVFI